jgi:lipopolysaccharide biosynthesis regulator YciM
MNNENILKHWDNKTLIETYYKSIARASGILSDVYDEEEDYSLKVKEAQRILKQAKEYKQELINRNDLTLLF